MNGNFTYRGSEFFICYIYHVMFFYTNIFIINYIFFYHNLQAVGKVLPSSLNNRLTLLLDLKRELVMMKLKMQLIRIKNFCF